MLVQRLSTIGATKSIEEKNEQFGFEGRFSDIRKTLSTNGVLSHQLRLSNRYAPPKRQGTA